MIRTLLNWLGFEIVYVCSWGEYTYRYDGSDEWIGRPIHTQMSVAPPWAKLKIKRQSKVTLWRNDGC